MNLFTRFSFFSVALACTPLFASGGFEVIGNRNLKPDALAQICDYRPEVPLKPSFFKDCLKSLYETNYFNNLDIAFDEERNTVILTVEEKPIVVAIAFEGLQEFKDNSFDSDLKTLKNRLVDEKKLATDITMISRKYSEKGYYFASVTYDLVPVSEGKVKVLFRVKENDPLYVSHVDIIGNYTLSDVELKSDQRFLTKEKRYASWLGGNNRFEEMIFANDKSVLEYLYRDAGFLKVTVSSPRVHLFPQKTSAMLDFSIEEGSQYFLKTVDIQGTVTEEEKKQILEELKNKNPKVFRISLHSLDQSLIQRFYGDLGYAFAEIVPRFEFHEEEKKVSVVWDVNKGERAYIGRIEISGNSKTRDNVIRRSIPLTEGELFSLSKIEKGQMNIERMGFFKPGTAIVKQIPRKADRRVDLKINVQEDSTAQLNGSLSISPGETGVHWGIQAGGAERNFLGKGYNLSLSLDAKTANVGKDSAFNYSLSLDFRNPSLYDGPWSYSLGAKYAIDHSEDIGTAKVVQDRTSTFSLSLGREIIEDFRFSLRYSLNMTTGYVSDPLLREFVEYNETERFSLSLSYDKTNNFANPTSGFSGDMSYSLAFPFLLGDWKFGIYKLKLDYYVPLTFSDSFSTNFKFTTAYQYVHPLGGEPIPYWQMLRLGSFYEMRAFWSNKIGPRQRLPEEFFRKNIVVGGNRLYYTGVEYFLPLASEINMRFVTFAEMGMVLGDAEKWSFDKFKYDIGMGIRIQTPIAPFRFEYAFPVEKGNLKEGVPIFTVGFDSNSQL